jgi:diguanylate cyclase (GGDEF)-like protein/PAS domain S-box-containing protein
MAQTGSRSGKRSQQSLRSRHPAGAAGPSSATTVAGSVADILELLPDAFLTTDATGRVTYANRRMQRLLGQSAAELQGAPLRWVFNSSGELQWLAGCERVLGEGGILQLREFDPHLGGTFDIHAHVTADGLLLSLRDAGTGMRRRSQEGSPAAAEAPDVATGVAPGGGSSSDSFELSVVRSLRGGIVAFDRKLDCRLWNPYMETMTGRPARDVVGKSAAEALPSFNTSELESHLRLALEGAAIRFHEMPIWVRNRTEERWVSGIYAPQLAADGGIVGVVALIQDVTERREAERHILRSAHHDPLTKLPNRTYFMDRLRRSLERGRYNPEFQFGMLFLDLDRFKVVNDSLGHLAGDSLLVQLAKRLEESVRPVDTVARLGGDEFGILLYSLSGEADAREIATRIQQRLEEPFDLEGRRFFTGASIGIALSSTGYDRAEDVLRDADLAMYTAKAEGTRRIAVFGRDMHEQALALLQLETDLRLALERDEFTLQYQPIVELASGRLTGFEALLRWQHPELGLISPAKFIAVAEETGLILPIGRWVLREACRQFRQWTGHRTGRRDPGISIHINLSGKQFVHAEGIEEITGILHEAGVDGRCIKLEITESVILENAHVVASALSELRARGIGLSIDDFGTGYSSLAYLHQFPFDTLKIDRSFVSSTTGPGDNLEIAGAIISLAHHLGMAVIAEGIETSSQKAELVKLGCEYGQGYFFSDALDADAAGAFYRRYRQTPLLVPGS